MNYILPINDETLVKGTFNYNDKDVYFEIPAIFNEGVCDEQATVDKINEFIARQQAWLIRAALREASADQAPPVQQA